jgi:hypothetical protein
LDFLFRKPFLLLFALKIKGKFVFIHFQTAFGRLLGVLCAFHCLDPFAAEPLRQTTDTFWAIKSPVPGKYFPGTGR